ncbi:MAG: DUF448 domain-containing protein [Myxococcales bacterium]|nr:DUF448 domain-containing protein [Myxococcales bacterium]
MKDEPVDLLVDEDMPLPEKGARTCAGCQKTGPRDAFVRLVSTGDDGDGSSVVVDAAGGAFGRGVHVHAAPACLEKAAKGGLSRAFKAKVTVSAAELAERIRDAYGRRATGLLITAWRKRALAIGADATAAALMEHEHAAVVVAQDAAHAATLGGVQQAVRDGRALVWLDRAALGAALGRNEVAVAAVLDGPIGRALVAAVNDVLAPLAAFGAPVAKDDVRGDACRSREVR